MMEESAGKADFSWVPFYEELAVRLARLFRAEPGPVLYESFRALFKAAGLAFPDPSRLAPEAFDFIDALALLNQRLADDKRAHLLEKLKASPLGEGMVSPVPQAFPGLIAMPLGLTLLRRGAKDAEIDDEGRMAAVDFFLWALDFARTMDKVEREEAADEFAWSYDRVRDGAAVPWNFTIALYWIAPRFYFPLDRWTVRSAVARGWWWDETPREAQGSLQYFRFCFPGGGFYLDRRGRIEKELAPGADAEAESTGIPGLVAVARSQWESKPRDPAAPRHWIFTPAENDLWSDEGWNAYLKAGEIAIPDAVELGDLSRYESRKAVFRGIEGASRHTKAPARLATDLWALRCMKRGDIVYAKRRFVDVFMSRGVVERAYDYEWSVSPEEPAWHCVKIRWGGLCEAEPGIESRKSFLLPDAIRDVTQTRALVEELERDLVVRPYSEADFRADPRISASRLADCRAVLETGKPIAVTGSCRHEARLHFAQSLAALANGVWDMSRAALCHIEKKAGRLVISAGVAKHWGLFKGEERSQAERFQACCRRAARDRLESRPETFFFIAIDTDFASLERANQWLLEFVAAEYRELVGNPRAALPSPEKVRLVALVDPEACGPIHDGDPALRVPPASLQERFAFFEYRPDFQLPCVQQWQAALDARGMGKPFREFVACLEAINAEIAGEPGLGHACAMGPMFLEEAAASKDIGWLRSSLFDFVQRRLTEWLDECFDGRGAGRLSESLEEEGPGARSSLWRRRLVLAIFGKDWRSCTIGGFELEDVLPDEGADDGSDADE